MKYNDKWGEFYRRKTSYKSIINTDSQVCYCMSGRTGMDLIIKDILAKKPTAKTIAVPMYCSHSMLEPIFLNNMSVTFYSITFSEKENKIVVSYNEEKSCDCLLIMDYFGFITSEVNEIVKKERIRGTTIIIDTTQCFLCDMDYDEMADYTLTSYRKWFAASTARVFSKEGFSIDGNGEINNTYEAMREEAFYLLGKSCLDDKKRGGQLLSKSEEMLERDYSMKFSSPREIGYVKAFDYVDMKKKRKNNAKFLIGEIQRYYPLLIPLFPEVKETDCPLCVPLLVNFDRYKLMDWLISQGFDCTYYWKISDLHPAECKNSILYKNELSLACDQRIEESELLRLSSCLKVFFINDMK